MQKQLLFNRGAQGDDHKAQLDIAVVAQAGSLLYRGLAIRRRADWQSAKRQVANLRHARRTARWGVVSSCARQSAGLRL